MLAWAIHATRKRCSCLSSPLLSSQIFSAFLISKLNLLKSRLSDTIYGLVEKPPTTTTTGTTKWPTPTSCREKKFTKRKKKKKKKKKKMMMMMTTKKRTMMREGAQ
jgi:hypothetical protein